MISWVIDVFLPH